MRVLTIGECMAELAPSGRDRDFTLGFAGDTFNTAWYLARTSTGIEVSYLTAVGDDPMSSDMLSFIKSSGVDTTHIRQIANETVGLYMIHLAQGERSFSYWRGQSAAKKLADDAAAVEKAISQADLIYFSGITLAILDHTARETLLAALRQGREAGKMIAFDTNLRPRLWSSPWDMKEATVRAAAQSDIVLPSYEDEAVWFDDANPTATVERYSHLGVKSVVVKNGERSVLYEDGGVRGEIAIEPVSDVVDTTAAGDSFNAGVLASLALGSGLHAGIQQGCQLAAQVVRHRGALVPIGTGRFSAGTPNMSVRGSQDAVS